MICKRKQSSVYNHLKESKDSPPVPEEESLVKENNQTLNRFALIDKVQILNNALKDPLNPAYIVFATSYIKTCDTNEAHNDLKEYLDIALKLALQNPFLKTSERVVMLWIEFSEKIGAPSIQRDNVLECFERNRLLALKIHPNIASLFPLELCISGKGYVLMNQESESSSVLIFQGCAGDDVQRVLEFRLYSSSTQYDLAFNAFRMNMQLVDYNTKIGLIVIESIASDPNILLNFQSYSNTWLESFISNNKHNMVAARMNPLDTQSQIFMHDYITVAESMKFTKAQCMAVINAFLRDLIDASIQDDPLSLYNEKCIQNWVLGYRKYYSQAEIEHYLERFNSGKLNWIRFNEIETKRFPIEIKIAKSSFIITNELGRGGYGVAFSGYMKGVSQDDLVIKLLFSESSYSRESFFNEIVALSRLKRLVMYEAAQLVICQKKVNGTPLDIVLNSCRRGSELEKSLSAKYMNLCQKFYDRYGLIHGDVRPENVIADENLNLQLIDFGMTKSASVLGPNAPAYLEKDILKSLTEYEFYFVKQDALKALDDPADKSSGGKILEYISILQKTNRDKQVQIWTKYFQQNYCSSHRCN